MTDLRGAGDRAVAAKACEARSTRSLSCFRKSYFKMRVFRSGQRGVTRRHERWIGMRWARRASEGWSFTGFKTYCVLQPPPYRNWTYQCWGAHAESFGRRVTHTGGNSMQTSCSSPSGPCIEMISTSQSNTVDPSRLSVAAFGRIAWMTSLQPIAAARRVSIHSEERALQ